MKNEIKYFSMFTGIGGFELGFEQANNMVSQSENKQSKKGRKRTSVKSESLLHSGSNSTFRGSKFRCVGFCENDRFASQVLNYRFPETRNYGNVAEITNEKLKRIPDFNLLCGGFPCQAFSLAGKRRGFEDARGTMFFEIARILKAKRPKTVLLENVKGLLNHEKGKTFFVILQTLYELGYDIQWVVYNSKFFGVPQNRERVFIVGSLRGSSRPEVLSFRREDQKVDGISEKENSLMQTRSSPEIVQLNSPTHSNNRVYSSDGVSPTINTAQGGNRQPKIRALLTPDRKNKRQNGRRFKNNGEPMFTLTGQDKHGVMQGVKIRRLTPKECERLQGFPEDWTKYGIDEKGQTVMISDTQRYKQTGNAVTVNVVKAIAGNLSINDCSKIREHCQDFSMKKAS